MSLHTAPSHPFEVTIQIGGDDWNYVIRTLDELANHISEHGPDCNMCSGGAGGSHSVMIIQRKGVTAEQYQAELRQWREWQRVGEELKTNVQPY